MLKPKCFLFVLLFLVSVLASSPLFADADWKSVRELPRADLSTLDKAQQDAALAILREENCTCGCSFKIAECLLKDEKCATSPSLADQVVRGIAQGTPMGEIVAGLAKKMEPPSATKPLQITPTGSAKIQPSAKPRLDLSGLSEQQTKDVMAILAMDKCTCGCNQKLDECLAKDLTCNVSPKMAAEVVKRVKGK